MPNHEAEAMRIKPWLAAVLLGALSTAAPAQERSNGESTSKPVRWFLEGGTSPDTKTAQVGLARDWDARWQFGSTTVSGLTEVSAGRWYVEHDARADRAGFNRISLTPTFRLAHAALENWFAEAAVGLNAFDHVYRTRNKNFSTAFQFGDHIGIGWRMPGAPQWEAVLRYEHFSNGSIKQPNPGEQFVEFRIGSRF